MNMNVDSGEQRAAELCWPDMKNEKWQMGLDCGGLNCSSKFTFIRDAVTDTADRAAQEGLGAAAA